MENKKNEVVSILDDDDDDDDDEEEEEEEEEDDEILMVTTAAATTTTTTTTVSNLSEGGRVESPIIIRSYTIIDFLDDVWIPIYSAIKNIRLIIGFLSKKITTLNEKKSGPKRECVEIRSAITDLLTDWTREGPLGVSCSRETLQKYLAEYRSKKFDANKVDPLLTRDIPKDRTLFATLKSDYDDYLEQLFDRMRATGVRGLKRTMPIVVPNGDNNNSNNNNEGEEEEEGTLKNSKKMSKRMKKKEETDVFDSSIFSDNEKQRTEEKTNKLQQFMTKLESDGNLCTWRTPGESGNTVIRIEVYNFKDVVLKEKRTWWKSARLRTQFLSQESCPTKLTGLLNDVARQMSKISGLTTEKRGVII